MMRYDLNTILEAALYWHHIDPREWKTMPATRKVTKVRIKQVVSFLAQEFGYSHKEIAAFLGLHRTTVICHIKKLKGIATSTPDTDPWWMPSGRSSAKILCLRK